MFSPKEVSILKYHGIDLDALARRQINHEKRIKCKPEVP
jgi:hypothetical protein